MNELENRVWRGLRDLADTVPHTPDARADLAARLAERRSRRPVAMVAAVAAVVVAAVALPVALVHREPLPPATHSSPVSPPPPGWVELGTYVENGATKHVGLSIDRDGKGFCVASPAWDRCYGVPVWGKDAPHGPYYVATIEVLDWPGAPDFRGPAYKLLLFVTAPQVATLDVAGMQEAPISVREVARTAEAAYFLADFGGPVPEWHYTARDPKGHLLTNATG